MVFSSSETSTFTLTPLPSLKLPDSSTSLMPSVLLKLSPPPTHKHGHVLDWVLHREDDDILQSTAIDHSHTSDHNCILIRLNSCSQPRRQLCACVETRNIASIDLAAFEADLNSGLQPSSSITAELPPTTSSTPQRHDANFQPTPFTLIVCCWAPASGGET